MPLKCALWRRFPVPPAAMLSFPFQLLRSLIQILCPPQCRIAGRQAPPGSAASGRETAGPDLLRKAGREARRRICTWLSAHAFNGFGRSGKEFEALAGFAGVI